MVHRTKRITNRTKITITMRDDLDYDGMVNKKKKIIQKISLWFSLVKKKPKRKSVWDL